MIKKCKICQHPTEIWINENYKQKKRFHYCTLCFFISLEDHFILSAEDEQKRYLEHNNSINDEPYVNRLKDFLFTILEPLTLNKFSNILDFGSGPRPIFYQILKEMYKNVDHYDFYFSKNQNYLTKQYHLITLVEVIEHLKNPLLVLKQLQKLLNKNSGIGIMTSYHCNDKEKFMKWWYQRDPTHISFFHPKTFIIIAEKLNMNTIDLNNKNISLLFN